MPSIQYSGKLSRNKGFRGGIRQTKHLRKDPPRKRGSAWQHKREADPALERGMNDSMKTRDAIDHSDSNSTAPGDAQGLNWLLRLEKKFASCSGPHWLVQDFSALAEQALLVYLAAALLDRHR